MYPTENISARVVMKPLDESKSPQVIGNLLEMIEGFSRETHGAVISWKQNARHEPTGTLMERRVSYNGNGHYKGFIIIEGSTIHQVAALSGLGETPEERQRNYLKQRLDGFVDAVLSRYFLIQSTDP